MEDILFDSIYTKKETPETYTPEVVEDLNETLKNFKTSKLDFAKMLINIDATDAINDYNKALKKYDEALIAMKDSNFYDVKNLLNDARRFLDSALQYNYYIVSGKPGPNHYLVLSLPNEIKTKSGIILQNAAKPSNTYKEGYIVAISNLFTMDGRPAYPTDKVGDRIRFRAGIDVEMEKCTVNGVEQLCYAINWTTVFYTYGTYVSKIGTSEPPILFSEITENSFNIKDNLKSGDLII